MHPKLAVCLQSASKFDVSNPSNYKEAGQRAKKRLNELLGPHGVAVNQVVTPRPKFSQEYESEIEQRNALGNQLEVIRSELARAETQRDRRLTEVDREQNNTIQSQRAALEFQLATAIAEQAQVKREADTYRITKLGEGQAKLSGASQRAKQLSGQLDAQFRAKQAEISAFKSQPVERVMEKIGQQLANVRVEIQPHANDANPSRVLLDK